MNTETTTLPITFEAYGETWTRHKPGDQCPCDWDAEVWVLMESIWTPAGVPATLPQQARYWLWSDQCPGRSIIAWRHAEPVKKETPADPKRIPTPRTDAAARKGAYFTAGKYPETCGKQIVHIDFARELEIENEQLRSVLQTAYNALVFSTGTLDPEGCTSTEVRQAIAALQPFLKPL